MCNANSRFFGGRMGVSLRDVNEASEGAVCLKALAYLHFYLLVDLPDSKFFKLQFEI